MGSEHYCLRWNNHQSNLLGVFSQLLQDESLVDVTLACAEGHSIRAHKVVLSACSSYFQTLFVDHPNRHPIVILKDVRFAELRTLVEFMYKGEVNVEYCQLSALLKTAESLKVKGLAEMTNINNSTREERPSESQQPQASASIPDAASPPPEMPPVGSKRLLDDDTDTPASPKRAAADDLADSCDEGGSRGNSPEPDEGPSDMTLANNCLGSPPGSEPIAGPSGMLPVQQVPLSLKKEVDWDRSGGDDKSTAGDSSSDYRHPHEPDILVVDGRYGSCALTTPVRSTDTQLSNPSSRCSTPFQFPFPAFPGYMGGTFGTGSESQGCSILSLLQQQGLLSAAVEEGRPTVFRCPVCLAAFPSAWLLEQHTSLQHALPASGEDDPPDEKPFRCDQCGQSYRYRSAYLKHREQNHRARLPADKLFTCDVCGMQFRYLKSFKKHRLNHALERLHSKSPHDVDFFSRSNGSIFRNQPEALDYKSKLLLMMQQEGERKVTAPPAATQPTPDGGIEQVSSSNEAVGSNSAGDRPATVSQSKPKVSKLSAEDYSYSGPAEGSATPEKKNSDGGGDQDETIDSLAFALSTATSSSNEAIRSAQEASLLNLLRLDAAERQRERRFACPFCGKCVRSKENLKLHVRKHTGERPFVCLFCGRAFGGKSDLTRHLRIHTGERPYHCEMCGKCFARADYLSKHLTTHIHNSQR